ncbi:MAG TPA: arylesterase [Nitrospiria bacterium]|nr:arylesterase [Nitrospiria bacterium]
MIKSALSWGILILVLIGGSACRQNSYDQANGNSSRTVGAQESASPPDHERVIVAFGDSLTAGLGVAEEEAYPAVLERKIHEAGFPYRVVNAGVSGETTAGGLRRVTWILQNRPEIVILELGANDGLRGLSLLETKKNLTGIIEALQREHVRIVLAGMRMPPNYGKEYTEAFEKIFPELAGRYRLTLIPFFLEGVAARPNLNQADGIHPTAQGYQIVVNNLWPKLEPLLVH